MPSDFRSGSHRPHQHEHAKGVVCWLLAIGGTHGGVYTWAYAATGTDSDRSGPDDNREGALHMTPYTRELNQLPDNTLVGGAVMHAPDGSVPGNYVTGSHNTCPSVTVPVTPLPLGTGKRLPKTLTGGKAVSRGISATLSTTFLQRAIWTRALFTADRFRVIRTLDVAAVCFSERNFKAALTAAQRAVRGMVKAGLLTRYRTLRFQTVMGLSQRGVDWLDEVGHEASSSVRRVSDMTNPEHRLWAQFLVLASEARGLRAMTEQELLQHLNKSTKPGEPQVQGLLRVTWTRGKKTVTQLLRPDAVSWHAVPWAASRDEVSCTWHEADISKRGSQRESALASLCESLGRSLADASVLRTVVISCKTERIQKRALAVLHGLAKANNAEVLTTDRRHFREVEPGIFEVWSARESKLRDGRAKLVDTLAGHVIIQLLPIWLPRVRIDSANKFSMEGWFDENYLPYRRPSSMPAWARVTSPLLRSVTVGPI